MNGIEKESLLAILDGFEKKTNSLTLSKLVLNTYKVDRHYTFNNKLYASGFYCIRKCIAVEIKPYFLFNFNDLFSFPDFKGSLYVP